MELERIKSIIESLLFVSERALSLDDLRRVFEGVELEQLRQAMMELLEEYSLNGEGGIIIKQVAGGYKFYTAPQNELWVKELFAYKGRARLSKAALETLAIIAYRQPINTPQIDEIRGIGSMGVIKTLLKKRLIKILGRQDVIGRPLLYGTTEEFLYHFGLQDLKSLPREDELEKLLEEE